LEVLKGTDKTVRICS